MQTFLFIHGFNPQSKKVDRMASYIANNLQAVVPETEFVSCELGSEFGTKLEQDESAWIAKSPTKEGNISQPSYELVPWKFLLEEPLCELRILSAMTRNQLMVQAHTDINLVIDYRSLLKELADSENLNSEFVAHDLADYFDDAVLDLTSSHDEIGTLAYSSENLERMQSALARCVVAKLTTLKYANELLCPTAEQCQSMVDILLKEFSARSPALISNLSLSHNADPSGKHAIHWSETECHSAARLSFRPMVEIVHYQSRRHAALEKVAKSIATLPDGLVILAHGLGSIAAVETLLKHNQLCAKVRRLYTIGSPVGCLYEGNALAGLEFGERLPTGFPDWTNIHDCSDVLSSPIKHLLGRSPSDFQLASNQPFPQSHAAYWSSTDLYKLIATEILLN